MEVRGELNVAAANTESEHVIEAAFDLKFVSAEAALRAVLHIAVDADILQTAHIFEDSASRYKPLGWEY